MIKYRNTPGPWEAVPVGDKRNIKDGFYIEETGQRAIVADVNYCCTDKWTRANAKLIAAAPWMLHMLHLILEVHPTKNDHNTYVEAVRQLVKQAVKDL